jgi:DNA primase
VNAGLVVEKQEGGGVYDRFRHRILFPIREMNGKMAGFGARRLNPEDEPNSSIRPRLNCLTKGGCSMDWMPPEKPSAPKISP